MDAVISYRFDDECVVFVEGDPYQHIVDWLTWQRFEEAVRLLAVMAEFNPVAHRKFELLGRLGTHG